MAQVAALNAGLGQVYSDIDGLLMSTLVVDDYVDLEKLKINQVVHPPFVPGSLANPAPPLPPLVYPPEPQFAPPPAPTGLAAAFGGERRHTDWVAQRRAAHEAVHYAWHQHCLQLHATYLAHSAARQQAENERLRLLEQAQATYTQDCRERETKAAEHDRQLTSLINELAFDVESAIQEYVSIVLSNSVYPEAFPVSHSQEFDIVSRELRISVAVPGPKEIPMIEEYRYVKSRDEIATVEVSLKEQKARYASAVWQVALRTLHEIFEADRAAKIKSIELAVSTYTIAPATGLSMAVPLAIVAAERAIFTTFDLSNVVPIATLEHLGAALSPEPFDLVPADTTAGVKRRG